MVISSTPEKLQQTTDEIGPNPDTQAVPFIYVENTKLRLKNVVINKTLSGSSNSLILGHDTNGVLGVANGVGGGQIVFGITAGDVKIEILRRAYGWKSLGDFNKGTRTNVDTSQGFIQLGNVTVKNISLEHKTK